MARTEPPPNPAAWPPGHVDGLVRVLVVDDDADILYVMDRALRAAGFVVTSLRSGEEAARWLAAGHAVDVLVVDHLLGDCTGAEVAAVARAHRPDCRTLLTTGASGAFDLEDAPGIGAVLFKPFGVGELVRAVHNLRRAPDRAA